MLKYKRVVIKLSGESLSGMDINGTVFNNQILQKIARSIKLLYEADVDVAIVVGAGNIFRGKMAKDMNIDRSSADYMGMLGTIINALALQGVIESLGIPTRVQTALQINQVAEPYIRRRAIRHLEKKRVVIFGGGTGNPYFTTDTSAALRAKEIDAELLIMVKNGVDGVYSADPKKDTTAYKIDSLSYMDVLNKSLAVMDNTAISLCMDNNLKIIVTNLDDEENLLKIVKGEEIGTIIS
ncbi:TPA: UMP kinase [bacterium]|nr:UMP kinase [bacterium]